MTRAKTLSVQHRQARFWHEWKQLRSPINPEEWSAALPRNTFNAPLSLSAIKSWSKERLTKTCLLWGKFIIASPIRQKADSSRCRSITSLSPLAVICSRWALQIIQKLETRPAVSISFLKESRQYWERKSTRNWLTRSTDYSQVKAIDWKRLQKLKG